MRQIGFKSISHSTGHVTHTLGYDRNVKVDLQSNCQWNVSQEEYLAQILQKHVMQCWFLPMLCQSQGINNCYNHCLSTFVNPWFILTYSNKPLGRGSL